MKSFNFISTLIFSIFLLFILSACNISNEAKKEKKPLNIIYIMADDHAYQASDDKTFIF